MRRNSTNKGQMFPKFLHWSRGKAKSKPNHRRQPVHVVFGTADLFIYNYTETLNSNNGKITRKTTDSCKTLISY